MNIQSSLPGFAINGVQVWPDIDDETVWYCLPSTPQPQLTQTGQPQVSLISLGSSALLQLGAQWTTSEDALRAVASAIATRLKRDPSFADKIRFVPAAAKISKVVLKIKGGDALEEVAVSRPSDMPPYAVALGAPLDGSKANAARASLDGQADQMVLRYEAVVSLAQHAEATLSGDVSKAMRKTPPILTPQQAATALKKFEESGALTWRRRASEGATEELRKRVDTAVREKAAALLIGLNGSAMRTDQSKIFSSAALKEASNCEVVREQDISEWLGKGNAAHSIKT